VASDDNDPLEADPHRALEDNDVVLMPAYQPGGPRPQDEPEVQTRWKISDEEDDEDEDASEDDEEKLSPLNVDERHAPVQEYPFFALGAAATLLLAFLAKPVAALIFGLTFLPAYAARRWLVGVIPDAAFMRFLSLLFGAGSVFVGALLVARWAGTGCVSLTPAPLVFLFGAKMVSSLFPRPLTFAITSGMFALVLLQAYATWAPAMCQ
jgi:hypothetical protein